jgi:hypothetical protein
MGSGGSRWGAGRPGWRRKCEHLLGLDIHRLVRAGYIKPSVYARGNWQWTWSHSGESSGNVCIETTYDQVRLTYTWTPHGREPQAFDYPVRIVRTPCRYGGARPWFQCPRCGDRRAVLYGLASDGRFGCRRCMRLAYAGEAEDLTGRLWRKQRKLEARLGKNYRRPKGMHQTTRDRILEQIWDAEMRRDEQLYLYMQRHAAGGCS